MKKVRVVVMSVFFMGAMLLGTVVFAANSRTKIMTLAKNSAWNIRSELQRSGTYYTVEANCYGVFPVDNSTDTFTRVKAQVVTPYQSPMTDVYTLVETGGVVTMTIKDGMLNHPIIYFRFCGNDPNYEAYAYIYYSAK